VNQCKVAEIWFFPSFSIDFYVKLFIINSIYPTDSCRMFSLSFAKLFFYLFIKPMVIIQTTIITYGYNSKLGSIPESPSIWKPGVHPGLSRSPGRACWGHQQSAVMVQGGQLWSKPQSAGGVLNQVLDLSFWVCDLSFTFSFHTEDSVLLTSLHTHTYHQSAHAIFNHYCVLRGNNYNEIESHGVTESNRNKGLKAHLQAYPSESILEESQRIKP